MNSTDLSMGQFLLKATETFSSLQDDDSHQICFIISDGLLNKSIVRPLAQEAEKKGQLYIFIIVNTQGEKSILTMQSTKVEQDEKGEFNIISQHYLEDFPFRNYIIIDDCKNLAKVLCDILRQYFEIYG